MFVLLLMAFPFQAFGYPMPELIAISEMKGQKGVWPGYNSPDIFNSGYEYEFDKLMARPVGRISDGKMPWADSWWPNKRGGIANQWQVTQEYPSHRYGYFQEERERILSLSAEELRKLSPAEKYDISQGDYSFTLTRNTLAQTSPAVPEWFGICDGWTAAALSHREPAPVSVTNPDGVVIEFGSSDVKAILAHFYTWQARGHTRQLGSRCSPRGRWRQGGDCTDTHPAAFHIVLVNQIGFLDQSFGADIDGFYLDDPDYARTGERKPRLEYQFEVWNQPIFAYQTRVLEQDDCSEGCSSAARGTTQRVRMETLMTYTDDDHPVWQASLGTRDFLQGSRKYEYWLEIDYRGMIVGGEWISEDRPDYLWVAEPRSFTGLYEGLNQIYQPAPEKPYCVPKRYLDQAAKQPESVVFPVSPVCAE
jgi:hypothetical protein